MEVKLTSEANNVEDVDYTQLDSVEFDGINHSDYPKYCDAFISNAEYNGRKLTESELEAIPDDLVHDYLMEYLY